MADLPHDPKKDYEWVQNKIKNIPLYLIALADLTKEDTLSQKEKQIASAAVEYIVNASDLIPDHLPSIGFVDDLLILFAALADLSKAERWVEIRSHHFVLVGFQEDLTKIRSYFAESYDKISELFAKTVENKKAFSPERMTEIVEKFNQSFPKIYKELPNPPVTLDILRIVKKYLNF